MTHPDPALTPSADETSVLREAPEAGVLSQVPTVRAAQEAVRAGVASHVQLAFANAQKHSGAGFRLRALLALLVGEKKSDTVLEMSNLVKDLTTCRDVVGERLDFADADDAVEYPDRPEARAA